MKFELPWNQCGVISELTKKLSTTSPQFGKTVLQKMVFLLQEVHHVDLGYSFNFYTYGPFAAELLGDLDFAQRVGAVEVLAVGLEVGHGYKIIPGKKVDEILQRTCSFLKENMSGIDAVVDSFGKKTAKELELLTTIVYLNKEVTSNEMTMTESDAVLKIRELKPKYSDNEVKQGLHELVTIHRLNLGFLKD